MQSIIAKLDQQIMEAQKTFQQLYAMRNETAASLKVKPAIPTPRLSEQQEIMQLARKGMDAEAIAKRLQKPIGEVELILNIQRLSSGR
jgi:DNA-binding NarL/FixJ family response regulator